MLQAFLQWFGFGLCHQLPERSFFGGGVQVPVCARDTGIYIGFMVSMLLVAWLHRGSRPREFPAPAGWVAIGIMVAAMGWDGVSSYAGFRTTTNDLRLITGLLAGYALGAIVAPMFNDVAWRTSNREHVLDPVWRLGVWLATVPLAFVVVRYLAPWLGVFYPLVVVAVILSTLTAVNAVLVCMLPAFDRKADRFRELWVPLLIAVGLSLLEIWLSGLLRLAIERFAGSIS